MPLLAGKEDGKEERKEWGEGNTWGRERGYTWSVAVFVAV